MEEKQDTSEDYFKRELGSRFKPSLDECLCVGDFIKKARVNELPNDSTFQVPQPLGFGGFMPGFLVSLIVKRDKAGSPIKTNLPSVEDSCAQIYETQVQDLYLIERGSDQQLLYHRGTQTTGEN